MNLPTYDDIVKGVSSNEQRMDSQIKQKQENGVYIDFTKFMSSHYEHEKDHCLLGLFIQNW